MPGPHQYQWRRRNLWLCFGWSLWIRSWGCFDRSLWRRSHHGWFGRGGWEEWGWGFWIPASQAYYSFHFDHHLRIYNTKGCCCIAFLVNLMIVTLPCAIFSCFGYLLGSSSVESVNLVPIYFKTEESRESSWYIFASRFCPQPSIILWHTFCSKISFEKSQTIKPNKISRIHII